MLQTHTLEIEQQYLIELIAGAKTFEIRRVSDERAFVVGDVLRFRHDGYVYDFEVTYIFEGGRFGVADDYVVMSVVQL